MLALLLLLAAFSSILPTNAENFRFKVADKDDQLVEAAALVARILPARHNSFNLSILDTENGLDVFELESIDTNHIAVRGSSGVMIAAGVNWYLKYKCMSQFSWNGDHIQIPDNLPPVKPALRVPWAAKYRYYFNTCTFGYSTVWWNWTRWEREIDFMALNGINFPLAFTGQEYIFSQVYAQLGLTQQQLDAEFYTGPAFLPWNRMGNVNAWAGPIPSTWNSDQLQLQKMILNRQRGLGMRPILPSFAGHVPPTMTQIFPKANISHLAPWAGFSNGTYFLDPSDPLFSKIATAYINLQTSLIGTDHFYNADPFNEEIPPSNNPAYLSGLAKAYLNSMTTPDPKAVWVMQGWFLYNARWFWGENQVKALLTSIPIGSLIMLDLYAEHVPVWTYTNSFYGHEFIWCYLGNFGGRSGMFGEILTIASGPLLARSRNSNNVGTGITPEAIEHNFITFELALEMAWRNTTVDLKSWTQGYINRRYGSENNDIVQAWTELVFTVFNCTDVFGWGGTYPSYIAYYPSLTLSYNLYYDPNVIEQAWSAMLNESSKLANVDTFRYDLAEITRQALTNRFLAKYLLLVKAYNSKDEATFDVLAHDLLTLINGTEAIVSTRREWLVGSWIDAATQLANKPEDQDILNMNARAQVTNWGPPKQPGLRDYAAHLWSGLVGDYYYNRWFVFLQDLRSSLQSHTPFDSRAYDERMVEYVAEWIINRDNKYLQQVQGDTIKVSLNLHSVRQVDL